MKNTLQLRLIVLLVLIISYFRFRFLIYLGVALLFAGFSQYFGVLPATTVFLWGMVISIPVYLLEFLVLPKLTKKTTKKNSKGEIEKSTEEVWADKSVWISRETLVKECALNAQEVFLFSNSVPVERAKEISFDSSQIIIEDLSSFGYGNFALSDVLKSSIAIEPGIYFYWTFQHDSKNKFVILCKEDAELSSDFKNSEIVLEGDCGIGTKESWEYLEEYLPDLKERDLREANFESLGEKDFVSKFGMIKVDNDYGDGTFTIRRSNKGNWLIVFLEPTE